MTKPRVGFLGTGWIGRHRMQAMIESGAILPVAVSDLSEECVQEAARLAPDAAVLPSLDAMLDARLDGLVIATPSALHAEQSIAALNRGIAVFCQKPLGRNAAEAQAVVDAAKNADRLLSVDFSYRLTSAIQAIEPLIRNGELGDLFAIDLTFHNAYGPDKPWFYDRAQSGGGCVMDLGVHLVDLALWLQDFPQVEHVSSRLFAGGQPLSPSSDEVEDYAVARLDLTNGVSVRLACSWRLQAGQEAVIEASFYGTNGGAALKNIGGSFYDFEALRFSGTSTDRLVQPPDEWGGRAAAAWAGRLADNPCFDPAAERLGDVADVLDRIYQPAG
ncbi:Gfo/Idh/MocA family protein [Altericroceibacterium xinjiangense]|uniref:Gfo/Idh/MocA family protein n=1 Tax=Altericroceibacterium xinjiangense TaxID=762261 RepID=UPI000F7F9CED|nr:Gfo/Idh/MocA family oxidoreductase [Altericroceibacterium xinjiangense]